MKLLLADDHILFRDALVQYIIRSDPDIEVSLSSDLSGVFSVMEESPDHDLILLDLKMPGMNGLKGLEEVINKFPDVPVALITGVAEKVDVEKAMEIGAAGYFPKTLSGKAVLEAIGDIFKGKKFVPVDPNTNSIMPAYHDDISSIDEVIADINLTPREVDVISYLVNGVSNKEIANSLGLQVVTVKLHVRGICRKLNVKNRTQAALKARELGFGN